VSLHATITLLEGTSEGVDKVVFRTMIPAGYTEFNSREQIMCEAVWMVENHGAWADRNGRPRIPPWTLMKIEYNADPVYLAKSEISNIIIWRGLLKDGAPEEHVLNQVQNHIVALYRLDQSEYGPQERVEWNNAYALAKYFSNALEESIKARADG
jgi:hypothetical protein